MRMTRTFSVAARAAACVVACVVTLAGVTQAQEMSGNGFLFGAPSGSFTFRAGYAGANANSDLFSQMTSDLSLRKGDFSSFGYGFDFAFALRPRLDLVVSADVSGMDKKSDYREWQDNAGKPIEQTTAFSRRAYAASLKYYLLPNGRTLGKFAWVPARYTPWVSAGLGRTQYQFKQSGDFIDFGDNNKVSRDSFSSSKWGGTLQAAAGIDWSINQRFALTSQVKYLSGKADLGLDYSGFDPIDLSGLGMTAGLTIRF
jgi:opacity protein-like surface antigen